MRPRNSGTPFLIAVLLCLALLLASPVSAFTADSLAITVSKNGDATAVFRFTLQGIVENAIPQSVLEDQLTKGLSTSSEPPELISMDRSSATLLMKGFAATSSVPTGTGYQTASMDFTKAEVALENSGLSSVITADFSPKSVTVTFPDNYTRSFSTVSSLPSLTHTVIDPAKAGSSGTAMDTGAIDVTSSPAGAEVYIDGALVGSTPGDFTEIAPGRHLVSVKKEGFDPVEETVNVTAGGTEQVFLPMLYSTPAPAPASSGFPKLPGFGAAIVIPALAIALLLGRWS